MSSATSTITTATTSTSTASSARVSPSNNSNDVHEVIEVIPPAEPFIRQNVIPQIERQNVPLVYARVKVPVYSNTHVEAWLASMDRWFAASGILNDTVRYDTICATIDSNVYAQLIEQLSTCPQDGKYEFVKRILITHFADSEQRKLNRLLSEMPLGDKRPSELYHEMKRVAGNVLGEAALKGLWAQRLPETVRPIVAASTGSAADYIKIADTVVDALAPSTIQQVSTSSSEMSELKAIIAELRQQIQNMPRRSRSNSRNRSSNQRNQTPSNSNHSANADVDPELCWYHQTYNTNAQNCRQPCRNHQQWLAARANASNNST